MKIILGLITVLSFIFVVEAQPINSSTSPKGKIIISPEKINPVNIPKLSTAPVIDGKLDDPIWKEASVFNDFYQIQPGDNIAPSRQTTAFLAYDAENLYFGVYCRDEPDQIRATIAKRDEVFNEDNVRIWLDTYNDRTRAYILGFNPYGVQQDGIYNEGSGTDYTVDIVMESKGMIISDGWTVEVKIPFKSLRYKAGKGRFWGFNVARSISRFNNEMDSWMPDDRNISGVLIKHGKIGGLEDIKSESILEIVPSLTFSETGKKVRTIPRHLLTSGAIDAGRFVNQPIQQDIGVNLKYSFNSNITLDVAVNPDYAEIEADAPVVTANQRFPLFFAEKRPFFLEGVEIFQSPLQIFYSRNIVDPDFAAKLTGKVGKTSFGFLAASDKAPGNYNEEDRNDPVVRPRINEFLDKNALFGVIRVKRDFRKDSNIGFFGTYRSFPEQRNIVGGFDGRVRINSATTSRFQFVGTTSRRCFFNPSFEPTTNTFQAKRNSEICDGATFNEYRTGNGFGYNWNISYRKKNHQIYSEAIGRTRFYRADSGFTRRTNTNNIFFSNQLNTEPRPKAKLIRIGWRQFGRVDFDWQGRSQFFRFGNDFNFAFQRNTFMYFETGGSFERLFEEEFGVKRSTTRNGRFFGTPERSSWQYYFTGNLDTNPIKKITLNLSYFFNNSAFDLDSGNGLKFPRVSPAAILGDGRLDPGTGKQFDFTANFEFRPINPFRVSLNYLKSRLVRNDSGKTSFDSNIFSFRSTYQFTRFIFVRGRLDHNTLTANSAGQFLFGWNPNPGTAFYAGYNDNFNYNGFSSFTGQFVPKFERNSRTFFIRASYLFRRSF